MKGLTLKPLAVSIHSKEGFLDERGLNSIDMIYHGYLVVECHGRASKIDGSTSFIGGYNSLHVNNVKVRFDGNWEDMDEHDGKFSNWAPLTLEDFKNPGELKAHWCCGLNEEAPEDAELGSVRLHYHVQTEDTDLEVGMPVTLDDEE